MREKVTLKILFLLLVSFAMFVCGACSQMSLFDLVESEQEGEFSLGVESVNLKVGSKFNFNSVGGYLPYTYAVDEGTGAIDSETGAYTAPGTEGEATVECNDGIGHRDSASVFIYEGITADPASFSIHASETTPKSITLTGGVGSLTASAELGVINPPETVSSGDSVSYSPPAAAGTDYIDVVDEVGNNLVIMVEVLPVAGSVDLEILPTYAVLAPNESQSFDITNTTGHSLTIALSESEPAFGTIDIHSIAFDVTSATIEYTAPSTETAVYLTVTDDDTGDSVQADIYVQAEVTALEISPSDVEVSLGTTVEFTASGGVPPYVFEQVNGTGTLVQTSPTTANYTPSSTVSQIRVVDKVGNQAKVKIKAK